MNPEVVKRIEAQERWTFQDCVGLASEFGIKTRAVIVAVMMYGKTYVEDPSAASSEDVTPSSS